MMSAANSLENIGKQNQKLASEPQNKDAFYISSVKQKPRLYNQSDYNQTPWLRWHQFTCLIYCDMVEFIESKWKSF